MLDAALNLLSSYLQETATNTLWFADENAMPLLQQLDAGYEHLYIICNRYDMYQLAIKKGVAVEYSDFDPITYAQPPTRILYRISKEKSLVHHLLHMSAKYLQHGGELILAGQKQDGVKGYHEKLLQNFSCKGNLKKKAGAYLGCYSHFKSNPDNNSLISDNYCCPQKIQTDRSTIPFFYSKPGIFGWKKIDRGSELLLDCLARFLHGKDTSTQSVLDLGCGYGWLFMNLSRRYNFAKIVGTDNNLAALSCAQKNSDSYTLHVDIIASDAGDKLTEKFDLIVCNPPFHQGFKHSRSLTCKFIGAIASKLQQTGSAFVVVNEFIPVEKIIQDWRLTATPVYRKDGFKVLKLIY